MVEIGDRIIELRKKQGWSQSELARRVGASREAIGKYERNEAQPAVDTAKKIADIFGVTLDYLVDASALHIYDKKIVVRIKSIQKLDDENQGHVFAMLDAFLLKCSIQNELATSSE